MFFTTKAYQNDPIRLKHTNVIQSDSGSKFFNHFLLILYIYYMNAISRTIEGLMRYTF